jgi:hypothetical protein
MNMSGKSAFYTVMAAGCMLVFTSCGKYSGRTPLPTKDQMSNNEWVYGNPEGPARQTLNTYPTNPDAIGRATEIRQMLFASDTAARGTHVAATRVGTDAPAAQTETPLEPASTPAQ